MEILASCSFVESQGYQGKIIVENEDGKNDTVSLNIVCSSKDELINAIKDARSCIKCITIKGFNLLDESLVADCSKDIFIEYTEDTISESKLLSEDSKVTSLYRVGESYSNMKVLRDICNTYPNVRVIGGNLLQIPDVRIGRYDIGKDKDSIIYNGIYDYFYEMPLSEMNNIKELTRKVRSRLSSIKVEKSRSSKPAVKKTSQVSKSFSNLFGDVSEEEF